jgi:dolichol-phosphate mannosyltransferase
MSLCIILPTYNESENLPLLMERLFSLPIDGLNVMIVDDNSPDGTGRVAEELAVKYDNRIKVLHRPGKLGLGSAYILGFHECLKTPTEFMVQMDSDFSHPPEKLIEMIQASENADVVIGSRYTKGGALDENWPVTRKMLSAFGNTYARMILGVHMKDLTGGFRLWKRAVVEAFPWDRIRSNGYVFQVETAYIAERMGFKIAEVPIYFAERKFGQSKMSLGIQMEAAVRVWQLRGMYRDIK